MPFNPESEPAASDPAKSESARSDRTRVLLVVVGLGLLLVAAAVLPVRGWLAALVDAMRALGPAGAVLFALVYALATVAMLPGTPLTLGAGYLYGPWVGSLVVAVGATSGAIAAFWLGRGLLRGSAEARIAAWPRFRALDAALARDGFRVVLLVRLSPVFPFNLVNYGMGLTGVGLLPYAAATFIGMLPAILLITGVGAGLSSIAELEGGADLGQRGQVLAGLGLAATAFVTAWIGRAARAALENTLPPDPPDEPHAPAPR